MGFNKLLITGVLIGVFVTLGMQWGIQEYQNMQAQAKLSAFMQGYENAADKDAFIKSYDFNGKGVTIGLSTSEASDEEGIFGIKDPCPALLEQLEALEAMEDGIIRASVNLNLSEKDFLKSMNQLTDSEGLIWDRLIEYKCKF